MKIKIRTKDFRFSMPVPVSMAGFVLKFLPERLFIEMRTNTPEPYAALVTRENLNMILWECMDIIKENKGLEIVHVEASDGTFVSIRL
ncbi:hypothetical protein HGO97_003485 [Faecalicatena sp. AGMB00832]|uniref:Uncharacterized protein n=1 Tax=Faecalicatena faecalis TaxID=2726362 RepID=A0ABS6D047_9FIRM|nr:MULTISPECIES: hypothetical protein [Faecalicatena]MBU3874876.1 hypothetical protein [Faecalicatena faecalis]MCI6465758.1 hypothetical protein [Faecalicatena sp.]MDY5618828.1 hypothetical protein [Lachnospiraceae bacterium]